MANLDSLFLFDNPPSLHIRVVATVLLVQGLVLGLMEFKGINQKFSKFANSKPGSPSTQISSRLGMFMGYAPTFLICSLVVSLLQIRLAPCKQFSSQIGSPAALNKFGSTQRSKVPFPHPGCCSHHSFPEESYGGMGIDTFIFLPLGSIFIVGNLLYDLQLSEQYLGQPSVNLIPLGIVLFIVGIIGNFYHHYLLSKLRKGGEKLYRVPQGALFGYVVCPHYFFELIGFLGVAFICQTHFAFCVITMMFSGLVGRSISTKEWYMKKFEDFPSHRKALIPFVM